MKKLLLTLFSIVAIGICASAQTEISLDKTTIQANDWGTSYNTHTYKDNSGLAFTFNKTSIQTSTITDYPVTKEGPIVVKAPENKTFQYAKFTLMQWGTKTKTAILKYSTDGGTTWSDFNPMVSSSTFSVEATIEITGVNAIQLSFSEARNQVGIMSFSYILQESSDNRQDIGLKYVKNGEVVTDDKVDVSDLASYVHPQLTRDAGFDNVGVTYSSSNENVASFNGETLTINGIGKTTITAEVADSHKETHKGSASYILTVTDAINCPSIVFKKQETDASAALSSISDLMEQVESGAEYIDSQSAITTSYVYGGKNGLKFSSSSKNGTLTFTLADKMCCREIVVTASPFGSDNCTLNLNNKGAQTISGEGNTYTYKFDNEDVSQISLVASKRLYVESITFVLYKVPAPVLTMPEGYNADTPVNLTEYSNGKVKYFDVTVSWPEGLTLHYKTKCRGTQLNGKTLEYSTEQLALDKEAAQKHQSALPELTYELTGDLTGTAAVSRSAGTNTVTFGFASQGTFECYVVDAAGNQSDKKPLIFQGQSTGVEDIVADGEKGEAVFYNMQGVRVANPAAGNLYIKVQGDKATKVLVK